MNDLYLECNSGISGDMAVAALIDAGADKTALQKALDTVPVKGFRTDITRVSKNGIDCADFNVILDEDHENHDHDMNYLFGHETGVQCEEHHHHEHEHTHEHEHDHEYEHTHEHEHDHDHEHHHHHEHRNLSDILEIIDKTEMTDGARKLAHKIFTIIAEAESKAHNLPVDKVHFHEVGALDSIVDVIALSVCFDSLNISRVFVPFLNEGVGTVRCQHGILPIPVPAVANIAKNYNLPLRIMNAHGEFITPTGAAFVAAVVTDSKLPECWTVKAIGMGAGKRAYERPSIVRAFIIEDTSDVSDTICKLETNIDDCTGEVLGFVIEELQKNGALDVHYVPCFMKKNRPAYILTVICKESDRESLEKIIFTHTTTIGIRRCIMKRTVLDRKSVLIKTPYGEVAAKEVRGNGVSRVSPEYESIAKIARETNKPFIEVYKEITDLCRNA